MSAIRAVLFDCDGVLQRPSIDWAGEIGAATGLEDEDLDAFLNEISAAEQPILDGSELYAGRLAAVVQRWALPVVVDELLGIWQHLVVDQEMVEVAEALRARGFACALATNQHRERSVYMRRELGYERVFDPMIISAEIGVAKPDPDFFRIAVDRLGVPAGEVLFMDDVEANVDGARSIGIVAEHFARDGGRPELDRILALHGLAEPVAA